MLKVRYWDSYLERGIFEWPFQCVLIYMHVGINFIMFEC